MKNTKEKIAQNDILIELHVPDFELAKEFYGKLGFRVVREKKPEGKDGYLVLKKDSSIICFWPGNELVWQQSYFKNFPKNTKRGYGVEIVIMVEDIEKSYNQAKKFAKVVEELKYRSWGLEDFRIEDPFGFYIRFTQKFNILNNTYEKKD